MQNLLKTGYLIKYMSFKYHTFTNVIEEVKIQGISEKCSGAFKLGSRVNTEVSIYPKVAAKAVSSV